MAFQRASKKKAKLRAALFGPSGAGKTYTALRIATGMKQPIAVIDTEQGSASKYADRFNFDVNELATYTIESYVVAIREAAERGYGVLILDSLSHSWQELLAEVDRLAKSKYRGNTWSAWSEGTPKQKQLVGAILAYPGHVIATMRSKTEWTTQTGSNGKSTPTRVGLTPEAGKGIEYEFDLLLELSTEHVANVIKDRTGKFQDKTIDKPGEDFGAELMAWLNEGDDPAPAPEPEERKPAQFANGNGAKPMTEAQRKRFFAIMREGGHDADTVKRWLAAEYGIESSKEITTDNYEAICNRLADSTPLVSAA